MGFRALFIGGLGLLATSVIGQERDYEFDGQISLTVLENYLSRSIEFLGVCCEDSSGPAPHLEDNLRLIGNVGAKFVGRAAYAWGCPADDDEHFRIAAENAARIHAIDPEIVLQACVFETAYSANAPEVADRNPPQSGVENVAIPAWAFEEFGLAPEDRNFSYEAMLYPDGQLRNLWVPGGSVPDISQVETKLWFFYRCARYVDAGYEAIHFGQTQLMGRNDPGFAHWKEVLERVRRYASTHARRRYVLCDAHFNMTHEDPGVLVDGKVLWDFLGFPLRPVETDEPLGTELRVGHGDTMYQRAPGGPHPGGFECDVIPQLYEFDNCFSGLSSGGIFTWGADESTWFANLKPERRDAVLWQYQEWIWRNAPRGHLEMPVRRPACVPVSEPGTWLYIANTPSAACPGGFGQEETIKSIYLDPRYADNATRPSAARADPTALPEDGLAGHWPCTSEEGLPRVIRQRSLEELRALYHVHGDRNPPEVVEQGREALERIAGDLLPMIVDGGARFRGDSHLYMGASPDLAAPRFAVALWIRMDDLGEQLVPLDKGEWMRAGYYIKYHPPESRLYGEIFDGADERRVVGFAGIEAGRWHHIALVADGESLTAYVDGRATDSVPAGRVLESTKPLTVGEGCSGVAVRDVRVYARALSADEVGGLAEASR